MPAAYFVVRATVSDPAKRAAFDAWYSREHMPDAVKSFGAEKAWRFWSLSDPSLHQATYQFADQASLDRAVNGAELKRLVADFNRDWPDVTRTRELLVLAEGVGGEAHRVVPANPGTHNLRFLFLPRNSTPRSSREDTAYGSPRSAGTTPEYLLTRSLSGHPIQRPFISARRNCLPHHSPSTKREMSWNAATF